MKKNKKILVGASLLTASLMLTGCDASKFIEEKDINALYNPAAKYNTQDVEDVYGPPIAYEEEDIEDEKDIDVPPVIYDDEEVQDVYGPPIAYDKEEPIEDEKEEKEEKEGEITKEDVEGNPPIIPAVYGPPSM